MIIETQNLTKRFGRHGAVDALNLQVPKGAAMALVGANGAGKTTTIKMLMNLLRADGGQASVLGVDSAALGAAEFGRIGYVSESQKLPEQLTVGQFFDYLRPLYPTWDRAAEDAIRDQYELPAGRKLGKLSHGMRMKACLASVLPCHPELLVLDEPLSGLDPFVRDEVIEGLTANAGDTTILISSHELTEIEGLATHVAFMDKGRLIFQDSIDDMSARFRDVTIGFAEDPVAATLPKTWMSPTWNGRTLRFITGDYAGDEALKRMIPAHLGPLAHFSAEAMSLRDTSKALMRAHRKDVY